MYAIAAHKAGVGHFGIFFGGGTPGTVIPVDFAISGVDTLHHDEYVSYEVVLCAANVGEK